MQLENSKLSEKVIFASLRFSSIKSELIQFQENLLQLENSKLSEKVIFSDLRFSSIKDELIKSQENLLQLENSKLSEKSDFCGFEIFESKNRVDIISRKFIAT